MVKFFGILLVLVSISFSYQSRLRAESWDLGYTKSSPEVEEIPDSINGDSKAEIAEDVAEEIREMLRSRT